MERTARGGRVRYRHQQRGISALLLLLCLPFVALGWASGIPAFWAVGGLLLLLALGLLKPTRALVIDREAGRVSIADTEYKRAPYRGSFRLDQVHAVRVDGNAVVLPLPDGHVLIVTQRRDADDARRFAERLAEDLGCPFRS